MIAFAPSHAPDVSVVVLVTREPLLVRPSLESLARALPDEMATEVIVVLNTARADTRALVLDGIRGARVIESPANCGTAAAWNVAFAAARGAHVALVHEDTHPHAGWILPLLETAAAHPRAWVVGSRVLPADGAVELGGWITWRDGWTTQLDGQSAPHLVGGDEPYAADWAGTAAMLVDRAAFLELGGFDEDTFPAPATNIGLCIAGYASGRTALIDPRSTVVHAHQAMVKADRGLYSGALFREFLIARSTRRIRARWADVLDVDYEPRGSVDPSGDQVPHARALAATERRARRPVPASAPPSRQSRHLSAPDGGWPTTLGGAEERLREAQREVDREFDAWVLADRASLRERILELDAGHAEATRAHANALEIIERLEADRRALVESKEAAERGHGNALAIVARLEAAAQQSA